MTNATAIASSTSTQRPIPSIQPAPAPAASKPRPTTTRTCHLVSDLAVTAPAVRSVIVFAWADGEEIGHEFLPVLGFQSLVRHEYSKSVPNGSYPADAPTHQELIRLGWGYEWTAVEHGPLIWFSEYGSIMPAEQALSGSNTAWSLAPCPWPPSEDEVRLLPAIEKTRLAAAEKDAESG